MFRPVFPAFWLLVSLPAFAVAEGFGLVGRITSDKPVTPIRVLLEDPKERNTAAADVITDQDGNYDIRGLKKREYRVVVFIDGKRQERRELEILCRTESTAIKDFHYGKTRSTLTLHFPAEDPDVVDLAELQGDYPKDVLRDYEKAYQDHINGNVARAIERLEAIASRAPGFYGAHARLGLLYQQEGCLSDAEGEYLQATKLSPRSIHPLLNLASAQIRAADMPGERDRMVARAVENLMKALEIRPSSAIAHCLMGAALTKIDSFEEAEKSFKRAVDLDGRLGASRLMLANLYLHLEKWGPAIQSLQAYLEDFPEAPDRSVVKEMLQDAQWKARR